MKKILQSLLIYTFSAILILLTVIMAFIIYELNFVDYQRELKVFSMANDSEKVFTIEMIYNDEIIYTKTLQAFEKSSFELEIYAENDYKINYNIGTHLGTQIYNTYNFENENLYILATSESKFIIKDTAFEDTKN